MAGQLDLTSPPPSAFARLPTENVVNSYANGNSPYQRVAIRCQAVDFYPHLQETVKPLSNLRIYFENERMLFTMCQVCKINQRGVKGVLNKTRDGGHHASFINVKSDTFQM